MVRAVRNLDLTVTDRELLVLVGPSGCGKSKTLRPIAGLEDGSTGQIRIGDRIVAGFIGSRRMSFLKGTLIQQDRPVQFEGCLGTFAIDTLGWSGADGLAGREVTLGIRAEHLTIDRPASSVGSGTGAAGTSFETPFRVDLCEPQGSRTIVHLSCHGGEKLVIAVPPTTEPRPGVAGNVRIDPGEVYIFDSDKNETRLT